MLNLFLCLHPTDPAQGKTDFRQSQKIIFTCDVKIIGKSVDLGNIMQHILAS